MKGRKRRAALHLLGPDDLHQRCSGERLKNHREQAKANPYSFKFLMNKYCFLVESPTEINKIKIQAFLESLKQAIMDSDPLQLLTTRFPGQPVLGLPTICQGQL